MLEDELCLWRPDDAELAKLRNHGIEVTLITGSAPWLGKRNHSYGHLVLSQLEPGIYALEKILPVPGVVPLLEKQKASPHVLVHLSYARGLQGNTSNAQRLWRRPDHHR